MNLYCECDADGDKEYGCHACEVKGCLLEAIGSFERMNADFNETLGWLKRAAKTYLEYAEKDLSR